VLRAFRFLPVEIISPDGFIPKFGGKQKETVFIHPPMNTDERR
jgi:hypothetical protein